MSAVGQTMIYLDNNATTQLDPMVLDMMTQVLRVGWANPSASYKGGRKNAESMEKVRLAVGINIGADGDQIVFTSGGTESNNTIIESAKSRWPARKRLVIGATEHPSISEPAKRWASDGGYVTQVPVDAQGLIDLTVLAEVLRKGDTALVSIMWANNETGVLAPMPEIVKLAHQHGALVHTDAVQAVGKVPVCVAAVPVDYLSMSGHKFHGPKGVGVLYVRKGAAFRPSALGGGQERGLRSGTENFAGIVALGYALGLMLEKPRAEIKAMRDAFEQRVMEAAGAVLNGHPTQRLDNTSSLTFPGVEAAGMLILLDEQGVSCSAGSACHAASVHPSPVLEAMGFDASHAASTLRFSFSRFNTMEESLRAADIVIAAANKMRSLNEGGPVLVS